MAKPIRRRPKRRRYALTLPELEHSKSVVLNSLGSLQSRRSYKHAIEEFIRWYCSFEIGGTKPISQQLSGNEQNSRLFQQPRPQSKIILKLVQFAFGQRLSYFPLRDRTSLSPEAETNTTRGSIQS